MGWPFGKKGAPEKPGKPRVIESEIPPDHERYGPAPPPPRTAHPPGVTVCGFDSVPAPHLLRLGEGSAGFIMEGEEGQRRSSALLILTAAGGGGGAAGPAAAAAPPLPSPGDVLVFSPSYSFEELWRPPHQPKHHIRRDGLAGRGVPGLAGLRTLHAGDGLTVLRLGPPPGARWVFVGLRAIAVFAGRLTLVDGEEARIASASQLALVADATATLYVEAGNDSALAVAIGSARVVSALG